MPINASLDLNMTFSQSATVFRIGQENVWYSVFCSVYNPTGIMTYADGNSKDIYTCKGEGVQSSVS